MRRREEGREGRRRRRRRIQNTKRVGREVLEMEHKGKDA